MGAAGIENYPKKIFEIAPATPFTFPKPVV